MEPHFSDFIQWAFYGLISGVCVYGTSVLSKMRDSVDKLNLQVRDFVVHNEYQKKMNDDFNSRLKDLEHDLN